VPQGAAPVSIYRCLVCASCPGLLLSVCLFPRAPGLPFATCTAGQEPNTQGAVSRRAARIKFVFLQFMVDQGIPGTFCQKRSLRGMVRPGCLRQSVCLSVQQSVHRSPGRSVALGERRAAVGWSVTL
jgi:hypothetical protein